MTSYEQLVCDLQEKTKGETKGVSIFIRNLQTNKEITIFNNTDRRYNWACIIFDPKRVDPMVLKQYPKDEREYYYCSRLEDLVEIADFLINKIDVWMTTISDEDALERIIYRLDD